MKIWQKIKFIKDDKVIRKYKLCGITLVRKEKSPFGRKFNCLGVKISKRYSSSPSSQEYLNFLCENNTNNFVDLSTDATTTTSSECKIIAFYLPQYHSISLNDENYGKGFTEWTNVAKTFPYYTGHYQPHIPYDVGFYDLSTPKVMYRQIELAKQYGINGFCFYYYWFGGQRLLETPLLNYLNNKDLDLPFCLCWANENWSKLWDGGNKDIIMPQDHKEEDDNQFCDDILPFFKDKRYITIDGKPLFILYKPKLLQKGHLIKFRTKLDLVCKQNGFAGIYFCIVYTSGTNVADYDKIFDAVVEFPPHEMKDMKKVDRSSMYVLPKVLCKIWDIAEYVNNAKYIYETKYKTFKGCFPSWDNSPRKAFTNGAIFHGSKPDVYKKWLKGCINWEKHHNPKSERLVFVNAWNEWGEGAHLEPDVRNGYAYLQATRDVCQKKSLSILLISHDMSIAGASLSLLGIAKILKQQGHCVSVYSFCSGALVKNFADLDIPVIIVSDNNFQTEKLQAYDIVLCNTILTYKFVEKCITEKVPYIWYVREALEIPEYCKKHEGLEDTLRKADITTVSDYAKSYIIPYTSNIRVIHNFVEDSFEHSSNLCKNQKIQFTIMGYFTPRKAFHICIDAFLALDKSLTDKAVLNIVGNMSKGTSAYWKPLYEKTKYNSNIVWHGEVVDQQKTEIFENTNVFVVPSFDESCSRIVLEACMYGKPCIVSENVGAKYLIDEQNGWIHKTGNTEDLKNIFQSIIENGFDTEKMGKISRERYLTTSTPEIYKQNLEKIIEEVLRNENI